MSSTEFRELISGRRRGLQAALMRLGLRLLEFPYAAAVRLRNRRYDRGAATVHIMPIKVVSVGNLTLGGTGKTPMVQWIARWFNDRGVRVAVVSRGYGARRRGVANDEALELERKLPAVPHVENPDRAAAVRQAIEQHAAQLAVLDDAFQHRRIARDLDIVLIDALEPLGFGHVFPRGTLREPVDGLRRADVVALSRADMLERRARDEIRRRVEALAPRALWLEIAHRPVALENASGEKHPVETLAGRPVAAFCGLGNAAGFRHTLASCGYRIAAFREFPDHHAYTAADVESLSAWAEELLSRDDAAEAVVCTCKDLVKLQVDRLGRLPLRSLCISLSFLSGKSEFERALSRHTPIVSAASGVGGAETRP